MYLRVLSRFILLLLPALATGPALAADDTVARGAAVYRAYCQGCHGSEAVGLAGFAGNLEAFRQILAATENMPDFSAVLDAADIEAVHAYVLARAPAAPGARP